ncbi:hypothetical protein [Synechococcus sp. MIT S1220]|uniref:hypothetical protein n=1 Tax=Synechococcus sp. MIT S1220 TaxID=3082549 RepID=UPI0039B05C2E
MRLEPPDKYTIAVLPSDHITRSGDYFFYPNPPIELKAHPQVPSNQPVLLCFSQKRGKPVQKQLLHCRLPKVLNPATKPTLVTLIRRINAGITRT